MSKSSELALKFAARIATISIANGYQTDIGTTVFRGRLSIEPKHMPCTVMVEGDDNVQDQSRSEVKVSQRYIFEGHMTLSEAQIDNPSDVAHLILSDLKKAVFGGDRSFDGFIRPNDLKYIGRNIGLREDGQPLVAASIEIDATYADSLID